MDGQGHRHVIIWGRWAHYAHCRVEFGSHNFVTDLAEWQHTIFKLLIEPSARNFNRSSALNQTRTWLYFHNHWLSVVVILHGRFSEEESVFFVTWPSWFDLDDLVDTPTYRCSRFRWGFCNGLGSINLSCWSGFRSSLGSAVNSQSLRILGLFILQ